MASGTVRISDEFEHKGKTYSAEGVATILGSYYEDYEYGYLSNSDFNFDRSDINTENVHIYEVREDEDVELTKEEYKEIDEVLVDMIYDGSYEIELEFD
ncbi:MAG: hypothetical protein MJ179_02690 [Treponema sp.]|nr:hypothetical protein [Treponema sp.]